MSFKSILLAGSVVAAAALSAGVAQAAPITSQLSVTYYSATSGADFGSTVGVNGAFDNTVLSNLGPDGLPVYNTSSADPVNDVNSNGEITWWTPSASTGISQTGTGTVTLPYDNGSLFPPNGTGSSDASAFQTAVFSGTFNLATAQTASFTLGADDDAFLYVDGTIVSDLGGVHANVSNPVETAALTAGQHTLELFYADRHQVAASLDFSLTSSGVVITPVPEPGSLLLLGSGLLGLGLVLRRRRRS